MAKAPRVRPFAGPALTLSVAAACAAGCGTAAAGGSAAASGPARGSNAPAGPANSAAARAGAPMILARCPVAGGGSPGPAATPGAPVRTTAPLRPVPTGRATPEPLRTLPPATSASAAGIGGATVTPTAVSMGTLSRSGSGGLGGTPSGLRGAWCEPSAGRCPPGYWSVYAKTLPGSKPRSLVPVIYVCSPAAPSAGAGGGMRVGG